MAPYAISLLLPLLLLPCAFAEKDVILLSQDPSLPPNTVKSGTTLRVQLVGVTCVGEVFPLWYKKSAECGLVSGSIAMVMYLNCDAACVCTAELPLYMHYAVLMVEQGLSVSGGLAKCPIIVQIPWDTIVFSPENPAVATDFQMALTGEDLNELQYALSAVRDCSVRGVESAKIASSSKSFSATVQWGVEGAVGVCFSADGISWEASPDAHVVGKQHITEARELSPVNNIESFQVSFTIAPGSTTADTASLVFMVKEGSSPGLTVGTVSSSTTDAVVVDFAAPVGSDAVTFCYSHDVNGFAKELGKADVSPCPEWWFQQGGTCVECPNKCSGRGVCLSRGCACVPHYSGDACEHYTLQGVSFSHPSGSSFVDAMEITVTPLDSGATVSYTVGTATTVSASQGAVTISFSTATHIGDITFTAKASRVGDLDSAEQSVTYTLKRTLDAPSITHTCEQRGSVYIIPQNVPCDFSVTCTTGTLPPVDPAAGQAPYPQPCNSSVSEVQFWQQGREHLKQVFTSFDVSSPGSMTLFAQSTVLGGAHYVDGVVATASFVLNKVSASPSVEVRPGVDATVRSPGAGVVTVLHTTEKGTTTTTSALAQLRVACDVVGENVIAASFRRNTSAAEAAAGGVDLYLDSPMVSQVVHVHVPLPPCVVEVKGSDVAFTGGVHYYSGAVSVSATFVANNANMQGRTFHTYMAKKDAGGSGAFTKASTISVDGVGATEVMCVVRHDDFVGTNYFTDSSETSTLITKKVSSGLVQLAATPLPGSYEGSVQDVTLLCSPVSDCSHYDLYITLDGSVPDSHSAASTKYTAPFPIVTTGVTVVTAKLLSLNVQYESSAPTTFLYTVQQKSPTPEVSPHANVVGGVVLHRDFQESVRLTTSANVEADVLYKIEGDVFKTFPAEGVLLEVGVHTVTFKQKLAAQFFVMSDEVTVEYLVCHVLLPCAVLPPTLDAAGEAVYHAHSVLVQLSTPESAGSVSSAEVDADTDTVLFTQPGVHPVTCQVVNNESDVYLNSPTQTFGFLVRGTLPPPQLSHPGGLYNTPITFRVEGFGPTDYDVPATGLEWTAVNLHTNERESHTGASHEVQLNGVYEVSVRTTYGASNPAEARFYVASEWLRLRVEVRLEATPPVFVVTEMMQHASQRFTPLQVTIRSPSGFSVQGNYLETTVMFDSLAPDLPQGASHGVVDVTAKHDEIVGDSEYRPALYSEPLVIGTFGVTRLTAQSHHALYVPSPPSTQDIYLRMTCANEVSTECGAYGRCVYTGPREIFPRCECDEQHIGLHCEQENSIPAGTSSSTVLLQEAWRLLQGYLLYFPAVVPKVGVIVSNEEDRWVGHLKKQTICGYSLSRDGIEGQLTLSTAHALFSVMRGEHETQEMLVWDIDRGCYLQRSHPVCVNLTLGRGADCFNRADMMVTDADKAAWADILKDTAAMMGLPQPLQEAVNNVHAYNDVAATVDSSEQATNLFLDEKRDTFAALAPLVPFLQKNVEYLAPRSMFSLEGLADNLKELAQEVYFASLAKEVDLAGLVSQLAQRWELFLETLQSNIRNGDWTSFLQLANEGLTAAVLHLWVLILNSLRYSPVQQSTAMSASTLRHIFAARQALWPVDPAQYALWAKYSKQSFVDVLPSASSALHTSVLVLKRLCFEVVDVLLPFDDFATVRCVREKYASANFDLASHETVQVGVVGFMECTALSENKASLDLSTARDGDEGVLLSGYVATQGSVFKNLKPKAEDDVAFKRAQKEQYSQQFSAAEWKGPTPLQQFLLEKRINCDAHKTEASISGGQRFASVQQSSCVLGHICDGLEPKLCATIPSDVDAEYFLSGSCEWRCKGSLVLHDGDCVKPSVGYFSGNGTAQTCQAPGRVAGSPFNTFSAFSTNGTQNNPTSCQQDALFAVISQESTVFPCTYSFAFDIVAHSALQSNATYPLVSVMNKQGDNWVADMVFALHDGYVVFETEHLRVQGLLQPKVLKKLSSNQAVAVALVVDSDGVSIFADGIVQSSALSSQCTTLSGFLSYGGYTGAKGETEGMPFPGYMSSVVFQESPAPPTVFLYTPYNTTALLSLPPMPSNDSVLGATCTSGFFLHTSACVRCPHNATTSQLPRTDISDCRCDEPTAAVVLGVCVANTTEKLPSLACADVSISDGTSVLGTYNELPQQTGETFVKHVELYSSVQNSVIKGRCECENPYAWCVFEGNTNGSVVSVTFDIVTPFDTACYLLHWVEAPLHEVPSIPCRTLVRVRQMLPTVPLFSVSPRNHTFDTLYQSHPLVIYSYLPHPWIFGESIGYGVKVSNLVQEGRHEHVAALARNVEALEQLGVLWASLIRSLTCSIKFEGQWVPLTHFTQFSHHISLESFFVVKVEYNGDAPDVLPSAQSHVLYSPREFRHMQGALVREVNQLEKRIVFEDEGGGWLDIAENILLVANLFLVIVVALSVSGGVFYTYDLARRRQEAYKQARRGTEQWHLLPATDADERLELPMHPLGGHDALQSTREGMELLAASEVSTLSFSSSDGEEEAGAPMLHQSALKPCGACDKLVPHREQFVKSALEPPMMVCSSCHKMLSLRAPMFK